MDIPLSTYRLQLSTSFGFDDVKALVPYLAKVGIGHIYSSPIFTARPGSTHGYDVVDPRAISSELGGESAFRRAARRARQHGLGWLQDIVPNHMAFDRGNAPLMNVLEHGEHSEFYRFFDIQWDHPYESLRGRVLAPFLGEFYGIALESGKIRLEFTKAGLAARYYDQWYPLMLASYRDVFSRGMAALEQEIGPGHPEIIRFLGALHFVATLINDRDTPADADRVRHAKDMLWTAYQESTNIQNHVARALTEYNGTPGDPRSFDLLDDLLSRQAFRLSFWKVAAEELNYRRFFTINDLIGVRVEDEPVFDYTHALVFGLCEEGLITGLRVDHIDGLWDPHQYLERLRARFPTTYLVVEKILGRTEHLPREWPVEGSTGYDFSAMVGGLFCRKRSARQFSRIYARFTGERRSYRQMLAEKKRLIVGKHLAGNVDNLAHRIKRIASREREGRDITLYALRRALVEVMVYFPVYRSYVAGENVRPQDRIVLEEAIDGAQNAYPELTYELNFIKDFLLQGDVFAHADEEEQERVLHFVMELQQQTGTLMAKGCEDTVFYTYNRLISLNEVGDDPEAFGVSRREFHDFCSRRARQRPHAMNATATHDSKRGEDTRMRIHVLSEMPARWKETVRRWTLLNRRKKKTRAGVPMPDANDEYFLYQTLVGTFPLDEAKEYDSWVERIHKYVVKAVREAKVHTAWIKPDTEYEQACSRFVDQLLKQKPETTFLDELRALSRDISFYGMLNSLSQLLLKITAPGVPDFYQGTELWQFSLVDPDNRRPIDYVLRNDLLARHTADGGRRAQSELCASLDKWHNGTVKFLLTFLALAARSRKRDVFDSGEYIPLRVGGRHANNVVAFARRAGEAWAVTIVPRLPVSLVTPGNFPLGEETWHNVVCRLPDGAPLQWENELTGSQIESTGAVAVGQALREFPVALLFGTTPRGA